MRKLILERVPMELRRRSQHPLPILAGNDGLDGVLQLLVRSLQAIRSGSGI
jgi:hypothetical protein